MSKKNVVDRDKKQDKLNYLIYQLKSFLERNNVENISWSDNSLTFDNASNFSTAVQLYKQHKAHWNSFVKHDVVHSKDELKFDFSIASVKKE